MKRFFFPCCLAMAMHALLFYLSTGWIEKISSPLAMSESLSLSLVCQQTKITKTSSAPLIQKLEKVKPHKNKKPKKHIKRSVKKKPAKKKIIQVKKLKIAPEKQKKPLSDKILPPPPQKTQQKDSTESLQPSQAKKRVTPGHNRNRQFTETVSAEMTLADHNPIPAGQQGKITRDARPVYLKNPRPLYPGLARRRGYEGVVLLEVLVDKTGRVKKLRIKKTCGYKILDRAAEKSVKKWLFEPAMAGENTIQTWVVIPIRFELR